MRKYLVGLFFIVLSCNSHNEKIIDRSVLVDVLVDLHLSDATMQIKSVHSRNVQVDFSHYDSIIVKHGISREDFEWNLVYCTYTKTLDGVMVDVIDSLNKIEGDIQQSILDLNDAKAKK